MASKCRALASASSRSPVNRRNLQSRPLGHRLPPHRYGRSYFNEHEVGVAIRRSGIERSDVFIETKVWISDYGYDQTLHACEKSTRKLGIDRLDLLILHQPLPSQFDLTIDAYRALETLLADGRVRAIGVSNFMPEHLKRLLAATTV